MVCIVMLSGHFKPVKNIKITVVKIDSRIENLNNLNENSAITKFAERREFGEWRGQKALV